MSALNLITFATCFSWLPSVVFGKAVASVTSVLSIRPMSTACCVVLLAAADERRLGVDACAGSPSTFRRAASSAAVPKPFSTSTWLSAVGAGAIDSGDGRLAAREDAARQRRDHREARRRRREAIGGAAAPPGLRRRDRRSPSATARPDRSARTADTAAARRLVVLRASAAAPAARRCTRPTASAGPTASCSSARLGCSPNGLPMLSGVIGSSVSRAIASPDALRAAAYALYSVVRASARPCCCRRCRRPGTRRPAPGSRSPARAALIRLKRCDAGGERRGAERVADARLAGLEQELAACDVHAISPPDTATTSRRDRRRSGRA